MIPQKTSKYYDKKNLTENMSKSSLWLSLSILSLPLIKGLMSCFPLLSISSFTNDFPDHCDGGCFFFPHITH